MKKIIDNKIKEQYGSQAAFCRKIAIKPQNFNKKFEVVNNSIKRVNKFLNPLNLEVRIYEK